MNKEPGHDKTKEKLSKWSA